MQNIQRVGFVWKFTLNFFCREKASIWKDLQWSISSVHYLWPVQQRVLCFSMKVEQSSNYVVQAIASTYNIYLFTVNLTISMWFRGKKVNVNFCRIIHVEFLSRIHMHLILVWRCTVGWSFVLWLSIVRFSYTIPSVHGLRNYTWFIHVFVSRNLIRSM